MLLQKNYQREGMFSKRDREKGQEWWSYNTKLFVLHVFTMDGNVWQWKINSVVEIKSKPIFSDKDLAYESAVRVINKMFEDSKI